MPDFTPKTFRIPQCLEPEFQQALRPLKLLLDQMVVGDIIQINVENSETVGGETPAQLHNASLLTGIIAFAVLAGFYIEGNLASGLASGATTTVSGKTINGKSIRSGTSLPNNTNFGAIWNGTDYTVLWANKCEA